MFITKNQTFTVSINSNVIFPCQVLGGKKVISDFVIVKQQNLDLRFFVAGVFYEKLVWEKTPQNANFLTTLNIQQPKIQLYLQNNLRINQVTNEEAGYYFCGIKGKLELNGNLSNSLYRIYKLELPGMRFCTCCLLLRSAIITVIKFAKQLTKKKEEILNLYTEQVPQVFRQDLFLASLCLMIVFRDRQTLEILHALC